MGSCGSALGWLISQGSQGVIGGLQGVIGVTGGVIERDGVCLLIFPWMNLVFKVNFRCGTLRTAG